MNLLEIIVIVITICLAAAGFRKGFVRKLASMLSLVLSIALVSFFLPYVTEFIKNNTAIYDYIVEQCESVIADLTANTLLETSDDSGPDREQIKELLEQYGYDSSVVDELSDAELEEYVDMYLDQYLTSYLNSDSDTQVIDTNTQMEIIDNLPVPQVLKDLLMDYNNAEGYERLQVTNFENYIIQFIASAVLNVISFLVAVILVQIILRLIIGALDLLAHLPVVGVVNRMAGLGLGLIQALFFLWVFFLILSMLQATATGSWLMTMVEQSSFLSTLYESNLFLNIVLQAAALFV